MIKTLERTTYTIAGEEYPYVKCSRCGIWIHEPKYKKHIDSAECDKWLKNRPIRERATARALGALNKVMR